MKLSRIREVHISKRFPNSAEPTQGTMEPKSLEVRTLGELRALARTAGLRGYSGMRKKQLIELLVKPKAPVERATS
jgi:hypothetical protein